MAQKSLESLPIDIHVNKLLDWLTNRRHCTQQCQVILTAIREKQGAAKEHTSSQAVSNNPIQELIEKPQLNYYQVKQLVELMKATDAGKTNLIGQYTTQCMKDWTEILKLYEKDGTYLAECAQSIVRNVNYEVPALKKQVTKCQQIQKDCQRKEQEYANSAADLRKQYKNSCKQIGIEGVKIKTELAGLVKDLPEQLSRFALSARSLESAVQFYDNFTSFLMKREDIVATNLPLLKHILAKGNTTTYEWRIGRAPSRVENQQITIDTSDEQHSKDDGDMDIDWGGDEGTEGTVDFGDSIDFDLGDITVESGGILAADGEVVLENPDIDAIDWGVVDESEVEVKSVEAEDVAVGKDALSVIDNPETRNTFIDNLLELKAFLAQRAHELTNMGGESSHMTSAPSSVHIGEEEVKVMLTQVKDILDKLTSVQMQHMMLIQDSPRYVDRLRDNLRQKLVLADKMALNEKEMAAMRQEAAEEEQELWPQIELLKQQTKVLKKQLEQEISKKYSDRKVNIIGEINMM